MWMPCAWTISAASRLPGMCRPAQRRRNPANGCLARAPSSSRRYGESWAVCHSLRRIWALITPDVGALRDQFHLPGMRVLQFAFDGHPDNPHLPENYTFEHRGVHRHPRQSPDARVVRGIARLPAANSLALYEAAEGRSQGCSPGIDGTGVVLALPRSRSCHCRMCSIFGAEARMNMPGRAEGNWLWRCPANILSVTGIEWLRNLTKTSRRAGVLRAL